MKNSKGFTLVELLAIIVIIGVILGVAAPNLSKHVKREKKEKQNVLNYKIENASKMYAAKYYADYLVNIIDGKNITNNVNEISFTLDDLELDGLVNLKGKCKNSKDENDNAIDKKSQKITLYKESNEIKYNFTEIEKLRKCYNKK